MAVGCLFGRLAQSLSLITDDQALLAALEAFAPAYREALRDRVFSRLGIATKNLDADTAFVLQTFSWLESAAVPWPQFWQDWQGGATRESVASGSPNKGYYSGSEFTRWRKALSAYEDTREGPEAARPPSLLYSEIGALWAPIAEHDDWSAFEAKLKSFTRP
jgi:uncharacterized protein YdiU (UPF0061 family)